MSKLKIAVIFGGCSEEHDVSVKSAAEIAANIDKTKYEPVYIGITKSGDWRVCDKPCAGFDSESSRMAVLSPDRKTHGLLLSQNGEWLAMRIDAVFPVIHGKTGEDGAIQGLLELSGIPYVGCGIQSSAVCMDKSLAYMVLRNAGIATPDFWVLNDESSSETDIASYPVFLKPARSGSSFGVTKVNCKSELDPAIARARQYDGKVLIEQAITGCEVGCAVLGNGTTLTVGEVDQINLKHGYFRIHQEDSPETGSENAIMTVPAKLPDSVSAQIQETAKSIYTALGCKGLARVDMFLQEDGRIVFNETNTMPGFTSYSRYPRMMAAAGLTLSEVIDRLITLALEG